jgi:hypothetical protein
MATKINLGINRKVGQPNFGSLGANCHVEFELDGPLDSDGSARFQSAVARAYAACRDAVERELAGRSQLVNDSTGDLPGNSTATVHADSVGSSQPAVGRSPADRAASSQSHRTPKLVTPNQLKAIRTIAGRFDLDLPTILAERCFVSSLDLLTCAAASQLIDYLKGLTTNDGAVATGK